MIEGKFNSEQMDTPMRWWEFISGELDVNFGGSVNHITLFCGMGALELIHRLHGPPSVVGCISDHVSVVHHPGLDHTMSSPESYKGLPCSSYSVVGMEGCDILFTYRMRSDES